jgi:hypothetical protein
MKKTIFGVVAIAVVAASTFLIKPVQAQCRTTGAYTIESDESSPCDCSISSSHPCNCCINPQDPS